VQKKYQVHDPSWIVIDEVLGILVTYALCPLKSFLGVFILFVLFRFFDIVKVWPASYFDRMTHGAGTILDDIVSGVYAGLVALLIKNFFPLV
jgi:phosphatidylglycerophosphatase A